MRISKNMLFLLLIVVLGGCVKSSLERKGTVFSFRFEGRQYQILSVSATFEDHYNLIKGSDWMWIDVDQDQKVDKSLRGNVGKEFAQKIYNFGIEEARKRGKLLRQIEQAVYTYKIGMVEYSIISFRPWGEKPYNDFLVDPRRSLSKKILKMRDLGADGTLNMIIDGSGEIEKYQKIYEQVLFMGFQEGKVVKKDNTFLVKRKYSLLYD